MPTAPSHYDTLEVAPDASPAEIRTAYRRLALEYHPDRIAHLGSHMQRLRRDAEEKLKAINEAYSVLSSPTLRQAYDDKLAAMRGAASGATVPPRPPVPSPPAPTNPNPDRPRSSQSGSTHDSSAASSVAGWAFVLAALVLTLAGWRGAARPPSAVPERVAVVSPVRAEPQAATDRMKKPQPQPVSNVPVVDSLDGSTLGVPLGVRYVSTPTGTGAYFERVSESRIQYPDLPVSGTFEWRLRIDRGYVYRDGILEQDSAQAPVFTTDCAGGDVTWPGSAWFWVRRDGAVVFNAATAKYQSPPAIQALAAGSSFRFGEWHTIGFSVGRKGVFVRVDGRVVAQDLVPFELGAGGDHDRVRDVATLGEANCANWQDNQHEGGFEGVVDWFRVSRAEIDWQRDLSASGEPR